MSKLFIINPDNPSALNLVHTGKEKYAVHLGGPNFFAFMDGHWSNVEYDRRPTFATDLSEALRMLEFAKGDGRWPNATIVILTEIVMEEVPSKSIGDHARLTGLAKLTEREKNALGIE